MKTAEELQAELDAIKAKIQDPDAFIAKNKELQDELAKAKLSKKELEDKLAKEAEDKKALEEKALAEKGEFKTLYEAEVKKREDAEKASKAEKEATNNLKKKDAVKNELIKLGLKPERAEIALSMVDPSKVIYNEELNVFSGVDVLANGIKNLSPEWFGTSKKVDHGGGGSGSPAEMSDEWFYSLPIPEQDKHRKEFLAKKGIVLKA